MDVDGNDIIEIIDLCTPIIGINDISIMPAFAENTSVLKTLLERFPNLQRRLCILASYPSNNHIQNDAEPLLSNIPAHQLGETELARRHPGTFKSAFEIVKNDTTVPSLLREKYHMFFDDLLKRLKVDIAILDFNYTRLNKYIRMLGYEHMRVFNLRPHEIQQIDEKEYPIALEFFLQFD
ncbi:unnamed protein product, partial [Rotaria sp. Silwood1]